ncbi:MAG: helix-turn-helix domain-containing protein, partial [Myxococcota bacterium]
DHAGRTIDRDELYDRIWGETFVPSSRTLDNHIMRLRKKIERDPKTPRIIRTVFGLGYRYDP